MGQAKARGTFEQRKAEAVERNRIAAEKAAEERAERQARRREIRGLRGLGAFTLGIAAAVSDAFLFEHYYVQQGESDE